MSDPERPQVLVVDDDPLIRVLLEEVLVEWGYAPVPCADGEAGWRTFLAVGEARLAIVDWVMPQLEGVELIRRIRTHERGTGRPPTYVILLTSRSSRDRVVEGLRSGANDYLVKDDHFQTRLEERLREAAKQIEFGQLVAKGGEESTEG